jgi:PAS domain S-box-containing protein
VEEATVKPRNAVKSFELEFSRFPGLAGFIKANYLREFITDQLRYCLELDVPIMKFFSSLTQEQLIEMSIPSTTEFLTAAENNKLQAHIDKSISNWVADQMEGLGRDDVQAEDITLISYVRKKALTKYLLLYTSDPVEIIETINEIDKFCVVNDTAVTNTYIDLLNDRISQHVHFIERVTNTSPGIIYVFDLLEGKEIYTNRAVTDFLGFTSEDLQMLGVGTSEYLIHPEDFHGITEYNRGFASAQEGEIRSIEYRIKNKQGQYIWMRAYESVFKRATDGTVFQKIGIAIDINEQKIIEEELKHSEEQLLEAQDIADLGSFEWNLLTRNISVTPKAMQILDLEKTGDMAYFMSKVHSSDRAKVKKAIDDAMSGSGNYECEYRLLTTDKKERIIWSKGIVGFENGVPATFNGTIMNVTERHHMVQRLQRSEELYKQAQARTHIGNWAWDMVLDKVTWSDEMYNIYGLEPQSETINFDRYISFIEKSERALRKSQVQELLETHVPTEAHFKVVLDDGTIKILQSKSEVLVDENGQAYKMIGTCQDVTDRQTLIEKLQRSEHLYKQAQAMSHIGNWTLDLNEQRLSWSDEMYRIYGLEPQSGISYEQIAAFNHPEDAERIATEVANVIQTRQPYDFNYRIILGSGDVRVVQARGEVILNQEGQATELHGTLQDITQQQKVELELRENREFIQKIANTTPSLIAAYNVNTGKYVFINKALEKILGYDPEQIIEQGVEFFMNIIHPDDLEPLMAKNMQALQNANDNPPAEGDEMVVEFKYRMRHAEGGYKWFHTYGTIFDRNHAGLVEHILNVSVDITEQEEAEQKLSEKNMQLQQSNASLEEYAYVASHDLKEPLRKIATFSDRLLSSQDSRLTEDGKVYLYKIIDSSRRMQAMISDLLAISVISNNNSFERHNLGDLLSDVLQTLEFKIEEAGAVIEFDGLPSVNVVASQIRQLFQNLLSNSLKFAGSEAGPVIRISHRFLSFAEVSRYNLLKAPRYIEIVFQDNGIGFDNQYANKIFTIFQRLHGRTEYEGTGIGLAICKKIVENHGGTIFANGTLNEGAKFTIIIPL